MARQPLMQRMREWFASELTPVLGGARIVGAARSRGGRDVRSTRTVAAPAAVMSYAGAPRPSAEGAGSPDEKRAYLTRVEEAAELVQYGRELSAMVISRETSDRRFNGAQIIVVELEVDDPEDGPRTITYEHVFGPAAARRWKPGRDIPIWIDRRDPERIYAGR